MKIVITVGGVLAALALFASGIFAYFTKNNGEAAFWFILGGLVTMGATSTFYYRGRNFS